MNIEKVTYKLVKDALENGVISPFIVKMLISYLTDEQRGAVIDEIINEHRSIEIKKGMKIWFNPKDNTYDLSSSGEKCYEEDIMKDAKLMSQGGCIVGTVINDCSYKDECNPYATEYKVNAHLKTKEDGDIEHKELRVKRSNIITVWKPLE